MSLIKQINWIIEQHVKTNHMYDTYLPYEFHLRMVNKNVEKYLYLLDNTYNLTDIILAGYGHDLMEDTRTNYNDIVSRLGVEAAEIIRAVTNYNRGRNRNERMPDFVYGDIVNVKGATFIKLCDRIANVEYSKMTGSSMFKKYKLENDEFLTKLKLITPDENVLESPYKHMVMYLMNLCYSK